MTVREVLPDIYWIGAIDWNRRLFDSLIPLPDGTSYNAYLVKGSEKTALIDTVDPAKEFEYVCNLIKLGVEKVDYIIVNHAEQDHWDHFPWLPTLSGCHGGDQREMQRSRRAPPGYPARTVPRGKGP